MDMFGSGVATGVVVLSFLVLHGLAGTDAVSREALAEWLRASSAVAQKLLLLQG